MCVLPDDRGPDRGAGPAILSFFLVIFRQQVAGYSALESGLTILPVTMVIFALSHRLEPRLFTGARPLISAGGILLLLRVEMDPSYATDLLPALVVFALGLSLTSPSSRRPS